MLHRRISLKIVVIVCLLMLSAIEAQGQGRQLFKAVKGFAFPEVQIRSFSANPVLPAISSFTHDLRLLAPALPAQQSVPQLLDRWQYFFKQTNTRPTKSIQIKKLYEEFERLHPEFREIYLPHAPQKVIKYEPLSSEWDIEWINLILREIERVLPSIRDYQDGNETKDVFRLRISPSEGIGTGFVKIENSRYDTEFQRAA